jgi:hypothetical protein
MIIQKNRKKSEALLMAESESEKARILKQKKTIKQHLDCEASVDEVLNKNRYVKHLLGVMNARGCPNSRRFFRCEECPEVSRCCCFVAVFCAFFLNLSCRTS